MKNILVTGASGYVGVQIIEELVSLKLGSDSIGEIVALDVFEPKNKNENVKYEVCDICNREQLNSIFIENKIDTLIHMAAILAPSERIPVEKMFEINVTGTQNLIESSKLSGVERIIYASSGAAYGYHEDNSEWLDEKRDQVRGNIEFPYSHHKRINEEDFLTLRETNPEIKQFIFRVGTVLGESVDNLITDMFKKPVIVGVKGSKAPFVFIWDKDLVQIFIQAIYSDKVGIYNVAGDGAVDLPDIAQALGKTFLPIPSVLIENALRVLKLTRLSQYGPEQVKFLKYRPVLDNKKLKETFEYVPEKTSREVFDFYLSSAFK